MSGVRRELDRLGRNIIKDAKKNARPNRKTGTLDRSLNYDTVITNDDTFTLVLEEVHYGKYLNNKTEYMNRAIEKNIESGISSIIDVLIDEITEEI